ncbi:MAG: N-acetylmuramoyl-L-alanine amidase [Alphaproteobacteria bacterium]|nr:N-acetylmuramoyl-L-alanine amidase [Alphaproteobacteria bacterium]
MFLWKKPKYVNCEERAKDADPNIILLHYTGMESAEAAYERLSNAEDKVSAHYIVYEDGDFDTIIPESLRAWHAGDAYWKGETDINSYSIGIEIVNPGHEFGYRPFPSEQMKTVMDLCKDIISRHDIEYVLGHSDVAPERKRDPGELFDWKWLAENGVGLWPDPTPEERERAEDLAIKDFDVEKLFSQFGFNPMAAFQDRVTAFQRHYHPEVFVNNTEGQVSSETVARLLSLLRQSA